MQETEPIDLDALDRAITGPDFQSFAMQNGPLRALIAEARYARAARKVLEARELHQVVDAALAELETDSH